MGRSELKKTLLNEGFTLIEVAIGLVILGLLVGPLLTGYKLEIKRKKITFNQSQFSEIRDNINFFVARQGNYPMPANLLATPASVDYGAEAVGAIANCATWPTANGVCRVGGGPNAVLIGAVPFAALGINPEFSYDFWHNKILYAVTEDQAGTYVPGAGTITTQAFDAARAIATMDNNVDMILVSHGETGEGAYTQTGVLIAACAAGGPTVDQENCDFDDTFMLRENKTVFPEIGSASLVPGPNFYDDLTDEQRSVPVDLWLQHLTTPNIALTFASRIGVGTEDPQAKVHVLGNLRADNNIMSDAVCNTGAAECFNPLIIAGAVPQMDCASNTLTGDQPVINLGNSQVYCASTVDTGGNPIDGTAFQFPAAFGRIDCADTAELMIGIDISGDPICATP